MTPTLQAYVDGVGVFRFSLRGQNNMVKNYMYVFLGGGIGAMACYWLSEFVCRWLPTTFPYGNLVVNITGCFLIGLMMTSLDERFLVQPTLRTFLTVGILGGFTTFSSFSYEIISPLRNGQYIRSTIYVTTTIISCLFATYIGTRLGKVKKKHLVMLTAC